MKQYHKSEKKWKKELKSIKKQNKMLFSTAKKSGSHREIKKIKKIREASHKRCDSSRDSYSDDTDSGSSLFSNNN